MPTGRTSRSFVTNALAVGGLRGEFDQRSTVTPLEWTAHLRLTEVAKVDEFHSRRYGRPHGDGVQPQPVAQEVRLDHRL